MTDKKFTDRKIIKALEYCLADTIECDKCALQRECESNPFYSTIAKYAFDLISSQKAEIGRLQKRTDEIKSEAYKECLTKVKNYIKTHCNPYGKPDFDYDTSIKILNFIDNLLKEMVGE